MENKMKLEIESVSANESFARVVVAAFMARMNPTLEEVSDVKTAVSEAVTNAIIHGYEEQTGIIYIESEVCGEKFIVKIRDEGCGIEDVEKAMTPLFTTKSEMERSGMGFSFMEAFMDEVIVKSKVLEGTEITMIKYIGREWEDKE